MKKPKIIAVVDNKSWCWTSTVNEMVACMPEFDFTVMPSNKFKEIESPDCDLVWGRGYSFDTHNGHDMPPFIFSMTTGHDLLPNRIMECEATGKSALGVICQNKLAQIELSKAGYENIWMIPNGVNCNMFTPREGFNGLGIGYAGNEERLELKGAPFVIDACELLGIPYVETTSGNPLPYSKMPSFYRNLFAYAQPSSSEGCSNSVMEAMACGLPCLIKKGIGYHGQACRDGIEHSDGQVVFVERNRDDIAHKLAILIENPYLYRRISMNARRFAILHDWTHVASKYRKLFIDILGKMKISCGEAHIEVPQRLADLKIPNHLINRKPDEPTYVTVMVNKGCNAFYRGQIYLGGQKFKINKDHLCNFESGAVTNLYGRKPE